MKLLALSLSAFVSLLLPAFLQAATPAAVEAGKAEFPAATATDSPKLRQLIAGYQQFVTQVTPKARKPLALLKDRLTRDQSAANKILHPVKATPTFTAAMRADAAEASGWLTDKFAPFLARAPL